jgi:hypothetical protein
VPEVTDRRVVGVVAVLVLVVLVLNVVSAVVPGMDGALAAAPVVVGILVAGTLLVMARALRR